MPYTCFELISECYGGRYGKDCAQLCVSHCRYAFCDHVTGRCDGGCAAGWTGSSCNECMRNIYTHTLRRFWNIILDPYRVQNMIIMNVLYSLI